MLRTNDNSGEGGVEGGEFYPPNKKTSIWRAGWLVTKSTAYTCHACHACTKTPVMPVFMRKRKARLFLDRGARGRLHGGGFHVMPRDIT